MSDSDIDMKYLGLSLVQRLNVQANFNLIHWGSGRALVSLRRRVGVRCDMPFPQARDRTHRYISNMSYHTFNPAGGKHKA
jgi:hypothetical protein